MTPDEQTLDPRAATEGGDADAPFGITSERLERCIATGESLWLDSFPPPPI